MTWSGSEVKRKRDGLFSRVNGHAIMERSLSPSNRAGPFEGIRKGVGGGGGGCRGS